jgi:ABC-type phosphate/phosphonate transport system substrate-binding protein
MQAALPMYFPPREALQAFWAALVGLLSQAPELRGIGIPERLSEPADCHAQWLDGDLLLSQACGYPLVTQLAGKVQLVGSLAYDAPGAQGIRCQSPLICRVNDARSTLADFANSTLAFNDTISQSGYNALRALVASTTKAPRPFFAETLQTGAHYRSIEAVRKGHADMAALDPVSWALWQKNHPALAAELKVFGQTDEYPGLPLITSLQTPPGLLAALRRALLTLSSDAGYGPLRAPLLINGFKVTTLDDYRTCLEMQELAFARGLPNL